MTLSIHRRTRRITDSTKTNHWVFPPVCIVSVAWHCTCFLYQYHDLSTRPKRPIKLATSKQACYFCHQLLTSLAAATEKLSGPISPPSIAFVTNESHRKIPTNWLFPCLPSTQPPSHSSPHPVIPVGACGYRPTWHQRRLDQGSYKISYNEGKLKSETLELELGLGEAVAVADHPEWRISTWEEGWGWGWGWALGVGGYRISCYMSRPQ